MKTFLKKSLILLAIIFSTTIVTNLSAVTSAYAADTREMGSCEKLLGLQSWDCGVAKDTSGWQGNENLTKNIWTIVANISNNILVIAAYLVLGYVIYGGYLYLLAGGDSGKVANGKKTLIHAFTGLAIVMLAKIIVSTIHVALLGSAGAFSGECAVAADNTNCLGVTGANTLVTNLIQWTIGIAGLVAAGFIVIGAIGYITASGDSAKLQKAKNTIIYALIGLAIVGLAEVITGFVSSSIRDAQKNALKPQTETTQTDDAPGTSFYNSSILTIAKERTHEK